MNKDNIVSMLKEISDMINLQDIKSATITIDDGVDVRISIVNPEEEYIMSEVNNRISRIAKVYDPDSTNITRIVQDVEDILDGDCIKIGNVIFYVDSLGRGQKILKQNGRVVFVSDALTYFKSLKDSKEDS